MTMFNNFKNIPSEASCNYCGEMFANDDELNDHKRKQHLGDDNSVLGGCMIFVLKFVGVLFIIAIVYACAIGSREYDKQLIKEAIEESTHNTK